MSKAMARYLYHPTEHFRGRLERVRRHDPEGFGRIREVIGRLLENPADADGVMHGAHRGKYKKYVGRREYRLLYYYCELCRKAARRLPEACLNCTSVADNSVIFFDVYHKNEKEKLNY
jgi:hypothetical protein